MTTNLSRDDFESFDRVFAREYNCYLCYGEVDSQGWEYGIIHYGHKFIKNQNIICSICYKKLKRPQICKICNVKFESTNKLFKHIRNEHQHIDTSNFWHTVKYPEKCTFCYLRFKTKEKLSKHVRNKHKQSLFAFNI